MTSNVILAIQLSNTTSPFHQPALLVGRQWFVYGQPLVYNLRVQGSTQQEDSMRKKEVIDRLHTLKQHYEQMHREIYYLDKALRELAIDFKSNIQRPNQEENVLEMKLYALEDWIKDIIEYNKLKTQSPKKSVPIVKVKEEDTSMWDEIARDLGYLNKEAFDNAIKNQSAAEKAMIERLVAILDRKTDTYEGTIKDGIDIARRIILSYRYE